jgi:hypothetical protein
VITAAALIGGYELTSNNEVAMSKLLRRRWASEAADGLPRGDRRSCDYETYVPVADLMSDAAEAANRELDASKV